MIIILIEIYMIQVNERKEFMKTKNKKLIKD